MLVGLLTLVLAGPAAAAGGRNNTAEFVFTGLPDRDGAIYLHLKKIAGQPEIERLEMTGAEVWRIPATRITAVTAAAKAANVAVERLDRRRMGAMLRMLPKAHPMTKSQSTMMSQTMASRSVIGMTMVRVPDPVMAEYAMKQAMAPDARTEGSSAAPVSIQLTAKERVTVRPKSVERSSDHAIWRGEIEGTGQPVTLLWWPSGRLAGTIHHKGRAYSIRSLGGMEHAVIEIAPEMLPEEHAPAPSSMLEKMGMRHDPLIRQGDASMLRTDRPPARAGTTDAPVAPGGPVTITVAVAYTKKAASYYSDIRRDLIEGVIVDANLSFINSGIEGVRLELVHAYETDYVESGSHFDHVWRFADKGDGYMEEIGGIRDRHAADIAVLVVHDPNGCGLSTRVAADAEEAYAVVHHECAQTSYSMAHEIGHILGARHDIALDDSDMPFPHGHGLVTPRWRTMMSYKNACNGCPRIPFWSNPAIRFRGIPTGSEKANNAAVIRAEAARVAAFRGGVAAAAADEAQR